MSDTTKKWTFGTLGVLAFFWAVGFFGNHSQRILDTFGNASRGFANAKLRVSKTWGAMAARRQDKKNAAEKETNDRRAAELKEATLKEFALAESPVLWKSIVQMREDIAEQRQRLESLHAAIKLMGDDPAQDADCASLSNECVCMQRALDGALTQLKDAYIESRKFDATMGKCEKADFNKRAQEEGADEAGSVERRYGTMRRNK